MSLAYKGLAVQSTSDVGNSESSPMAEGPDPGRQEMPTGSDNMQLIRQLSLDSPAGSVIGSLASSESVSAVTFSKRSEVAGGVGTFPKYSAEESGVTFSKRSPTAFAAPSLSSLDDLLIQTRQFDDQFREIVAREDDVRFSERSVAHGLDIFQRDADTTSRLCGIVSAPDGYLKKLGEPVQRLALDAHRELGHFGGGPGKDLKLTVRGEQELVSITRNDIKTLTISEVVTASGEGLGNDRDQFFVKKLTLDCDIFEVELVSRSMAIAVRR